MGCMLADGITFVWFTRAKEQVYTLAFMPYR